jgi:hypothetical protein
MKGSVLSFLKAEWKVSDTGPAQCWASSSSLPSNVNSWPLSIHFMSILGHDHDRMVVGFTTTCVIGAYHHLKLWLGIPLKVYSIQHYVIKFISDLRQVCGFLPVLWFPPLRYNWNIVESDVKHHKLNQTYSCKLEIRLCPYLSFFPLPWHITGSSNRSNMTGATKWGRN